MMPSIDELQSVLQNTATETLPQAIVNAPFKYKREMVLMGIGIIVFLVASKEDGQIHRIALCNTDLAEQTRRISLKKFEDIKIPRDHSENIIVHAIESHEPQMTTDWKYLFTPSLLPEQARLNQAGGGIACSFVYPIYFGDNEAAMIFSYFKESTDIGTDERKFMDAYSLVVAKRLSSNKDVLRTIFPA